MRSANNLVNYIQYFHWNVEQWGKECLDRGEACPAHSLPVKIYLPSPFHASICVARRVVYITEKVKGCCIKRGWKAADFLEIVFGEKGDAECSDESSPYVLSPYDFFLEYIVS
jgi:hypothetical protein